MHTLTANDATTLILSVRQHPALDRNWIGAAVSRLSALG
jgi:hypothetical protein